MSEDARYQLQDMLRKTGVFELNKAPDPIASAATLLREAGWRVEEPDADGRDSTDRVFLVGARTMAKMRDAHRAEVNELRDQILTLKIELHEARRAASKPVTP